MLSPFALLQKPSSSKESDMVPLDAASVEFTGKIDRRLSFVFVALFILVLVVGGTSFYLLRSHLLKSDVIARQSEQIEFVEQIESRLQSFTAEIQLAQLQSRAIPDALVKTSLKDLDALLALYRKSGGATRNIEELQQMIADAGRVA